MVDATAPEDGEAPLRILLLEDSDLDAELLGIETQDGEYLASVRFSGLIREGRNMPPQSFDEVWNLSKPLQGSAGWILSGIQQMGTSH